ncbi:Spo0E family sporulation regulatory protein-aspartic acid phosphatase [Siminovitchia sediminis]|uniref:Spo0E family sporulation regulatory protein-aspartic acid phosphatase n=1 Tax=Siminovitchia sediminis TaxID=1274353 RepID=A0ABW4KL35_9BACI
MTSEQEKLLAQIEKQRKEMVELGLARSFADERVVKLSDQLDQLLNQYQFIDNKN